MLWIIFDPKTKTFDTQEYISKPTDLDDDIDKFVGDRKVKSRGFLNHLDMRMNAGHHAEFLSRLYDIAKWVFFVKFNDGDSPLVYVFTLNTTKR